MDNYLELLSKLSVNVRNGHTAPHKSILLLSVLNFIEAGVLDDGKLYLNTDIEASFKSNWEKFVGDNDTFSCNLALPFYYMSSEPYWKLVKSPIYEHRDNYNLSSLKENFEYAQIDLQFIEFFKNKNNRAIGRVILISKYLASTHGIKSAHSIGTTYKTKSTSTPKVTSHFSDSASLYYAPYTAKSFVIFGDTAPHKEFLRSIHATFSSRAHKGGPGWLLSNKRKKAALDHFGSRITYIPGDDASASSKPKNTSEPQNTMSKEEWRQQSAGYQWVKERLLAGAKRKNIVTGFNKYFREGREGFCTRQGKKLSEAILSAWAKDILK